MPVNDESLEIMQCEPITTAIEGDVREEDVKFAKESTSSEFEVLECSDGLCHIRFADGSEAYVGEDLSHEDIMTEKDYI